MADKTKNAGGAPTSFNSVRSIWQQRANQTAKEKESQPPPSPSSKASAALGGVPSVDPFSGYGISFSPDNNHALVVSSSISASVLFFLRHQFSVFTLNMQGVNSVNDFSHLVCS